MKKQSNGNNEHLSELRTALNKYFSQRKGGAKKSCFILYCGYLGDQTELEVQLWNLVQSSLDPEEEEKILKHTNDCKYCQARIRDITRSIRLVIQERPDLLEVMEAARGADISAMEKSVRGIHSIKFRRSVARVLEKGLRPLAEILVPIDDAGDYILGEAGGVLLVRYAHRGGNGIMGVPGGAPKAFPDLTDAALKKSINLKSEIVGQDLTLSCDIQRSGNSLILVFRCLDKTGEALKREFLIVFTIDGSKKEKKAFNAMGEALLTLPLDCKQAVIEIWRGAAVISIVTID